MSIKKSFQDLADSGKRLMGKGECVDCHKISGKFKRCFQCNKSNQRYWNERKQREEEYSKKSRILMITRGKECIKKGGKCDYHICPNCKPIESYDDNLKCFVNETLDYLLKEQGEEDLTELEMLEKEFEQAIK
jgi:hypothetical protein